MPRKKSVTIAPVANTESKRERFQRLVVPRMQRVITSIRLLGNLATNNYEFREEDVQAMRTAIVDQMNESLGRFEKSSRREVKFTLPLAVGDL